MTGLALLLGAQPLALLLFTPSFTGPHFRKSDAGQGKFPECGGSSILAPRVKGFLTVCRNEFKHMPELGLKSKFIREGLKKMPRQKKQRQKAKTGSKDKKKP